MQEHQKIKSNIPPQKPPTKPTSKPPPQEATKNPPLGNSKPSIKVYEQKNNMIFGDNNYNYW